MRLGFILPSDAERQQIGVLQEQVIDLRPDQIAHLEHLLRSWRVFGRADGISATHRAIKRVLRDKP